MIGINMEVIGLDAILHFVISKNLIDFKKFIVHKIDKYTIVKNENLLLIESTTYEITNHCDYFNLMYVIKSPQILSMFEKSYKLCL